MTDRLWAPWRVKYVTTIVKKDDSDLFVRIGRSRQDKKNYVFKRSRHSYSVLNIYPYNNGHTLIVPGRKVKDLAELKREERDDLFDLLNETKGLLDKVLHPEGYNIGINLSRVAGAGIPGHLHIHLVPRWKGDVNFMPVVGGTKVISQSLDALYERLVKAQKTKTTKKRTRK